MTSVCRLLLGRWGAVVTGGALCDVGLPLRSVGAVVTGGALCVIS